jgi:stage V sporulation protein R
MNLPEHEAIEFAKLNAEVIQPSKTSINPYYLGLKLFEDIAAKHGEEAIFEVREIESDQSFLRNYLTKELIEKLDIYNFAKVGLQWKIVDKNWETVRDNLVKAKTNGGFPVLIVKDGDFLMNGELYIEHQYEGLELDVKYLEKTIPYVYKLWGRNVHLSTVMEGREVVFTYDGKKTHRRFV